MKKTLMLIAISLTAYSAGALANINFQLNNPTNDKLILIESAARVGGLHVPHILYPLSTDPSGHSTTSAKESLGYFSYGIDSLNHCSVSYRQGWDFKTYYKVQVKSVGKVFCRLKTDSAHASRKIIDFAIFPN